MIGRSRIDRYEPSPLQIAARLLVGGACLAGTLLLSGTAQAGVAAPGCGLVPKSEVNSAYGAHFGAPTAETEGAVTVCNYFAPDAVGSVLVRFQVKETTKQFAAARQAFQQRGEPSVTRSGFGQMAYSVVLGSKRTLTSTIVVLKGSTELLVTGPGALSKVEGLAKEILPKL